MPSRFKQSSRRSFLNRRGLLIVNLLGLTIATGMCAASSPFVGAITFLVVQPTLLWLFLLWRIFTTKRLDVRFFTRRIPRFVTLGLVASTPLLLLLRELELLPFSLEAYKLSAAKDRGEHTSSLAPLAVKPTISTKADVPNTFIDAFNKPLPRSAERTPDTNVSARLRATALQACLRGGNAACQCAQVRVESSDRERSHAEAPGDLGRAGVLGKVPSDPRRRGRKRTPSGLRFYR
jgi:hypothetical protein